MSFEDSRILAQHSAILKSHTHTYTHTRKPVCLYRDINVKRLGYDFFKVVQLHQLRIAFPQHVHRRAGLDASPTAGQPSSSRPILAIQPKLPGHARPCAWSSSDDSLFALIEHERAAWKNRLGLAAFGALAEYPNFKHFLETA